jgi:hypothetical protein
MSVDVSLPFTFPLVAGPSLDDYHASRLLFMFFLGIYGKMAENNLRVKAFPLYKKSGVSYGFLYPPDGREHFC